MRMLQQVKYSKTDPSSLGKNYWALQPVWAISYIPPVGVNADLKMMYDFNFRNNDTKTRSGQAFHADYALGWGFGNGWVAGIGAMHFGKRQMIADQIQLKEKLEPILLGLQFAMLTRKGGYLLLNGKRILKSETVQKVPKFI